MRNKAKAWAEEEAEANRKRLAFHTEHTTLSSAKLIELKLNNFFMLKW